MALPATPAVTLRRATSAHPATLAGVFCLSLASLLLELSLTRLFSVVLFYHFAFLAISIALLGLGSGGLMAFLVSGRRDAPGANRPGNLNPQQVGLVAHACLGSAVTTVLALLIILHARITLDVTLGNFLRLSVIYFVAAIPFFCNGMALSTVLAVCAEDVHRVYFIDLAGAAAACLALVPIMNHLGGPSAVLLAAALAVIAAGGFFASLPATSAARVRRLAILGTVTLLLVVVAVADAHGRFLDLVYAKGQKREHIEFKKWNSFSRVEVRGGDYKDILIDADADTAIVGASPAEARANPELFANYMRYSAALPYVLRPAGKDLIIGPGGGSDVMRALLSGSGDVTAAEINPIIVRDIMQGRYRDWSKGLYLRPDVHAVVAEGRSFVRRSPEHYDVIQATMVDTWASTAAGALSLSENNLYTVEAFREYLRHLAPDGTVAMTRWEFREPREALRIVAVGMDALRQELGVTDPTGYFAVVSDGPLNEFGKTVTTLIRRRPFHLSEIQTLQAYVAQHPPLTVQYLPGVAGQNDAYARLLASRDPTAFSAQYPYNVSPSTDDQPFFFYTVKTAAALGVIHAAHGMDWKNNLALFLLLSLLGISLLAVAAFLLIPVALLRGVPRSQGATLLYFVALGLGYILIEVAFIQRFVLYLGHPTYALTVVVFFMLAASSLGSLWSRRLAGTPTGLRLGLLGIIGLALLYRSWLGGWLGGGLGLSLAAKIGISALLLLPIAGLMGLPFPSGIRGLNAKGRGGVEWAWALNAAASVLGSVLAILLAIHFGLSAVLLAGAAAYLLALLLAGRVLPTAA